MRRGALTAQALGAARAAMMAASSRRRTRSTFSLAEQAELRSSTLRVLSVPGLGRGCFAARDLAEGETVLEEAPFLVAPPAEDLASACATCLSPRAMEWARGGERGRLRSAGAGKGAPGRPSPPPPLGAGERPPSPRPPGPAGALIYFCSAACEAEAEATWLPVEDAAAASFAELWAAAAERHERFPVAVGRAAAGDARRRLGEGAGSGGPPRPRSPPEGAPFVRGSLEDLESLCFARLDEPPPPWVDFQEGLAGAVREGLAALASARLAGAGAPDGPSDGPPAPAPSRLPDPLPSPSWAVSALARVHLNAFRVDTVALPDPSCGLAGSPGRAGGAGDAEPTSPGAALEARRAAMLAALSAPPRGGGSAVFALASMLNHSCSPTCDVLWPHNDSRLRIRASRPVPEGEQLTISYVDVDLEVAERRRQLEFAYGFRCRCARCRQEADERE